MYVKKITQVYHFFDDFCRSQKHYEIILRKKRRFKFVTTY